MSSEEKTFLLKSEGGLDTVSSAIELFETPGLAARLMNFQPTVSSGYEQVRGYQKFGTAAPGGAISAKVTSVYSYYDGAVCTKGGKIYFSQDGNSWIQVNKNTAGAFHNATTLAPLASLNRNTSSTEQYRFVEYHNGTNLELLFCDTLGTNPISRLTIRGTSTLEYKYENSIASEWPSSTIKYPTFIEVHNDRMVAGGFSTDKTLLHYSNLFNPLDFAGGGFIDNADELIWAKGFRKNLMIFGRNKISEVISLGNSAQQTIQDVTRNIGCISGDSIQEVGGDLVFLAPDGIRTIAATARIGDVSLSTLSVKINPLLHEYIVNLNQYTISSTVIRNRNNYRIFFHKAGELSKAQKGIGGVLRGGQGGLQWEWCEYRGLPCYSVQTSYTSAGKEVSYHASNDDFVYLHDVTDKFNGADIPAVYQTPEISLGDSGFRKTLHAIQLYAKSTTGYTTSIKLTYDDVADPSRSPPGYRIEVDHTGSAYYSETNYGTAIYGRSKDPYERVLVEGSGKTFNIKVASIGSANYSIQGMAITYFVNGRQ
jgi:hypothetical protein|tara:strand:+ start:714 stop:2330 length:1617 start_codon:yes stop_codon:yes gene_type:complete